MPRITGEVEHGHRFLLATTVIYENLGYGPGRDAATFRVRFNFRPADRDVTAQATPASAPNAVRAVATSDRIELYKLALELSARVFTVVELAEVERYYIRDQLERKSTIVPQLVAQALARADMAARRALYVRARQMTTDCLAILDVLNERGTVEPEAVAAARAVAVAIAGQLDELTVPPPLVW